MTFLLFKLGFNAKEMLLYTVYYKMYLPKSINKVRREVRT
jgi:hypothetical protein